MDLLSGSTRKTLLISFVLCSVLLLRPASRAFGQETQYTPEEYAAYQAITGETDIAKKSDLITQFFKTYPKSTLKQHVVADFQTALKTLEDGKKWTQLITVGREFLSAVPDDTYTIALVAAAYSETKNYSQFVVFGEAAYKSNPSPNLAYAMAKAYKSLGNTAKFLSWAEITVSKLPDNYEMLLELASGYGDLNRTAEAEKYARLCLKAMQAAAKPEQTSEKDWTAYKTHALMACYYIIGSTAYQKTDYVNAISNLENSLKYNTRNDMAYYLLGMSYWNTRKLDMAAKNFAKAELLGGNIAPSARQQLENMWKASHQGSLTGLDRVRAVAKAELTKK